MIEMKLDATNKNAFYRESAHGDNVWEKGYGSNFYMKVYEFGEENHPVILLLPGTCCYWRANFGGVIEGLSEKFRVACVSYDGFDETEHTEFSSMTEETEKIENYIKAHYGGRICAAYGCSLGGTFVALLAAREQIHMDYGIIGSSDFDKAGKIMAKLQTRILVPVLYPLIHTGEFKSKWLKERMKRRVAEMGEYGEAFMKMFGLGEYDLTFITKPSIERQFYSDLVTPLPEKIAPESTEIHVLYALKMGEKYRARYEKYFAKPVIHELDMLHEELLAAHPVEWVALMEEICGL